MEKYFYAPYVQINNLVFEMLDATVDTNSLYESKTTGQKLVTIPPDVSISVQEKIIKSLCNKDKILMIFI